MIPGEIIAEGSHTASANVMRVDDKLYSTRVGLAEFGKDGVRVIPLAGPYIPRIDDVVVGKIIEYSTFGWDVDIHSCFQAFLPAQNVFGREYSPANDILTRKFDIGDMLAAKIASFDRTRDPLLNVSDNGLGKIPQGEIIKIGPTKVPRVIGKKGSMIKLIEAGSGTQLSIGQNGIVVAVGSPEHVLKAIEAIRLVERDAHVADLTEKVQALFNGPQEG